MVFNRVELEITSFCNARCPGCARTLHRDNLVLQHLSLDQIIRNFPANSINNVSFKLCGVLGDPIVNPECLDIVKYLTEHGGYVEINTNGSYGRVSFWEELGKISRKTGNLRIHFCVDGERETNHIYRVNTSYDLIETNMMIYSSVGGKGDWIFIVFDHNEHELETAKQRAKDLGFKFIIKTGMRNSLNVWKGEITTSKGHSKSDEFKDMMSDDLVKVSETISCKFHDGEIFIASNNTLWPCCFIWDSVFRQRMDFSYLPEGWNDLNNNSIEDVLNTDYFREELPKTWHPSHEHHSKRCIVSCGRNRLYQNELTEVD